MRRPTALEPLAQSSDEGLQRIRAAESKMEADREEALRQQVLRSMNGFAPRGSKPAPKPSRLKSLQRR